MATTKKRADGNYQRSITIGRKPDGRPMRKTIYAKTRKELETKVAEFQRQLSHGMLSDNDKMTFGELAKIWLESYKNTVSESTKRRYQSILKIHLLPELENFKLRSLKSHNLQMIINDMAEDDYAEKTMKEVKNAAASILEIAIDNDILMRNVFRKIVIPQLGKNERRALTASEIEMFNRSYDKHKFAIPALVMLYCGLRRGELLALNWNDIDLKSKYISVNKSVYFINNAVHLKEPKTKAGVRSVPIPDFLIPMLQSFKKTSTLFCPSVEGKLMTLSAYRSAWSGYMHYLNIQEGGRDASRSRPKLQVIGNITPHMLRHTYATMLYDAGVDVKSAQKFLGHAEISTTLKIYTHLSEQKEQSAVDALNSHIYNQIV